MIIGISIVLIKLVVFFSTGSDPTKHGLTTNNARIEGLRDSKLYKGAMERKQRCVVICDGTESNHDMVGIVSTCPFSFLGFYEWQTSRDSGTSTKQPYLVYAPQPSGVKIESMSDCSVQTCFDEVRGWVGPRPLFMAGIYSEWRGPDWTEGQDPTYSYSVLTRYWDMI